MYIVLHTATRHLLGIDGMWQLDLSALPPRLLQRDVTFLIGDIHTYDVRHIGDARVVSPGSLYPQKINEMLSGHGGGCVLVGTDSVEPVDVSVRIYASCSASDLADCVKKVVAESSRKGYSTKPYVLVENAPDGFMVPVSLVDSCVFRISGAAEQSLVSIDADAEGESFSDVLGEESDDETLVDLARSLVAADDPTAEIQSWLDFWGVSQIH